MTAQADNGGWGYLGQPIRCTPPEIERPWRDNAYLAFWDPAAGVFGSTHVSTSPNAAGRRARFSLNAGGRVRELVEELPPGTFAGESIDFDLNGRITIDSKDLSGELRLEPQFATADYSHRAIFPGLVEAEPLRHYQQSCRVEGRLVFNGAEITVNGSGFRDRTWGYRDEHATIAEHIAVMATFDRRALSLLRFRTPAGADRTEGYVLTDSASPISSISVTRDPRALFARARFACTDGARIDLEATERPAGFWVPVGTRRNGPALSVYDEFLAIRDETGKAGFAMVEHGVLRELH